MPGLMAQPPAPNLGKCDSRRFARGRIGEKLINFAAAELPKPDPQQILKKRLRAEMEALRGLVKKAEILAGKAANGVAPPRRRFLEAEARVGTKEAQGAACVKKRKTMPLATIVESRMMLSKAANDCPEPRCVKEARRFLGADARPEAAACAKKRKTMLPAEIVVPRKPKREIVSLANCVPSLSSWTPTHIEKEEAKKSKPIPSPHQQEEGEIVEEEDDDVLIEICGGPSPVPADKVQRSSPLFLEGGKTEEENVMVGKSGEASPVAVEMFPEATNSPSSSSSSSGSSCSDSSDSHSSSSSGSSCSDSSDSDSSDSDDDAESVRSGPAHAIPAKRSVSPVAASSKVLCPSSCPREEGEIMEEVCVGASLVAAEKFAETGNSPRSTSSFSTSVDDDSVGSSPARIFLPKRGEAPEKPMKPVPAPRMSHLLSKARDRMRQLRREPKRQKAYEELEAMDRNAVPTNWIHPMHMMEYGITIVEYVVTSDRLVAGRGGPLEQWFGLTWKGE